jgi:hypothetical protein
MFPTVNCLVELTNKTKCVFTSLNNGFSKPIASSYNMLSIPERNRHLLVTIFKVLIAEASHQNKSLSSLKGLRVIAKNLKHNSLHHKEDLKVFFNTCNEAYKQLYPVHNRDHGITEQCFKAENTLRVLSYLVAYNGIESNYLNSINNLCVEICEFENASSTCIVNKIRHVYKLLEVFNKASIVFIPPEHIVAIYISDFLHAAIEKTGYGEALLLNRVSAEERKHIFENRDKQILAIRQALSKELKKTLAGQCLEEKLKSTFCMEPFSGIYFDESDCQYIKDKFYILKYNVAGIMNESGCIDSRHAFPDREYID